MGYYPACPPAGDGPHTYRFTLFALGDRLDVTAGARRDAVQRAIDDATLERARLTATYERS
ncbi:YbhB/YbcL family Raf kinase inhibitor-like protein [Halogeometricum sp. CBA1124]|uniref:YbhB/YbcL family Raf kinase inhibitor-like protein n=1 Tax=Halogeometricum sp. CBA1124 TaxID=2668071 RepID=UPI0037423973